MKSAVKLVFMMCVFCAVAFAQDKPKVAVYVTGGKNAAENQAFIARITLGLVNSGKYNTIERTDVFLDQVAREQKTQRSGAVDDKQITAIGKQFGASFVCVGEIVEAFGGYQISVRILNVESALVTAAGSAAGQIYNIDNFVALADNAVAQMLGLKVEAKQASPTSAVGTYNQTNATAASSAPTYNHSGGNTAAVQQPAPSSANMGNVSGTSNASAEQQLLKTGTLILDPIIFPAGKSDIPDKTKPYLNTIAKMLVKYQNLKIEIGGHTDNIGNPNTNETMSQKRAEAVLNYLVSVESSLAKILTAKGYGGTAPIADNRTAAGRQKNRRVELKIIGR